MMTICTVNVSTDPGFLIELLADGVQFVSDDGTSVRQVSHLLHMSIFGLMLVHSVIDLAIHLGAPLPPGLDSLSLSAAFAWYGLAFSFHTSHSDEVGLAFLSFVSVCF